MAIKTVDLLGLAHERGKCQVIMDTRKMHAWLQYYPDPGDHDDLHCHPGDQTFIVLEGLCTIHFPEGGKTEMKPGCVALIEGGSFYALENIGDGPLVMMGTRTGPHSANKHIHYETGEDLRGKLKMRDTQGNRGKGSKGDTYDPVLKG